MDTLGKQIRKARIDKDISQKELAEILGVKQQYLSRIERDEIDVRLSMLLRIAASLRMSPGELIAPLRMAEVSSEQGTEETERSATAAA